MTRHEFKVGDFARNVESGWLGRIEKIQAPETVKVDEKTSFVETMVRMVGVDELALTVGGGTVEQCISENDVQWFSTVDLKPVTIRNESGLHAQYENRRISS